MKKFAAFLKKLKFVRNAKLILFFEKRIVPRQNLSLNSFQSVAVYYLGPV